MDLMKKIKTAWTSRSLDTFVFILAPISPLALAYYVGYSYSYALVKSY